jgi:hypothetical protein
MPERKRDRVNAGVMRAHHVKPSPRAEPLRKALTTRLAPEPHDTPERHCATQDHMLPAGAALHPATSPMNAKPNPARRKTVRVYPESVPTSPQPGPASTSTYTPPMPKRESSKMSSPELAPFLSHTRRPWGALQVRPILALFGFCASLVVSSLRGILSLLHSHGGPRAHSRISASGASAV